MIPTLPILAFAAPLGADSAAVCTAMGARERIVWRRRLAIALTLTSFEALTPALGMLLSGPAGRYMGGWSTYVAAGLLVALGGWFFAHAGHSDDDETPTVTGWGTLVALAIAVSVDEVAVGVSLGLAGVAVLPLVLTVAVWVFAATMTGLTLGARLGKRFERHAGTFAAGALVALGVLLALGVL